MPHIFEQSTGKWYGPDHTLWGTGWAGQLLGRNNPSMQDARKVGPLPRGWYTIGKSYHHPHLGEVTMNLDPDPTNDEFDRSDFRIHGYGSDVVHASEGCVIQIRPVRISIDASPDRRLQVVASITDNVPITTVTPSTVVVPSQLL